MSLQAIEDGPGSPESGGFFHRKTALRIGVDLARLARDGLARGDAAQMEALFLEVSELLQRDGASVLEAILRDAAVFVPRPGAPVFERLLMSTPDLRAGIIAVHPLRPIPLHDHPGLWSAQRVIRGRFRVRRYDFGRQQASSPSLAWLERLDDRTLQTREMTLVTPSKGNIHGFAAVGRTAVMLSLRARPDTDAPGSWFLPVDPMYDAAPTLLCNRVRRPTS